MKDLGVYIVFLDEETGKIHVIEQLEGREYVFDNPEEVANKVEDDLGSVWRRK